MTTAPEAPALTELLDNAPTNWGKWGPDDEVGSLNYLTAEQVIAGASLIKKGALFTLQRLIATRRVIRSGRAAAPPPAR